MNSVYQLSSQASIEICREYSGLKLHTPIVMLGTFIDHKRTGTVWINSIDYCSTSIPKLIEEIQKGLLSNSKKLLALAVLLGVSAVSLIYIIFVKRGKEKAARQFLDGVRVRESMANISESYFCIICYENQRNVCFKPCGHIISCALCMEHLPEKKCPVCKEEIEDYKFVKFS